MHSIRSAQRNAIQWRFRAKSATNKTSEGMRFKWRGLGTPRHCVAFCPRPAAIECNGAYEPSENNENASFRRETDTSNFVSDRLPEIVAPLYLACYIRDW